MVRTTGQDGRWQPVKQFNFTEWALKRQQLIWFFVLLIFVMGVFSYRNLGRMEDPDFTIKQMLVIARDTENSLMETNYPKIVTTQNPEYLKLVNTLVQQTQEHKKLIMDKIRIEAEI